MTDEQPLEAVDLDRVIETGVEFGRDQATMATRVLGGMVATLQEQEHWSVPPILVAFELGADGDFSMLAAKPIPSDGLTDLAEVIDAEIDKLANSNLPQLAAPVGVLAFFAIGFTGVRRSRDANRVEDLDIPTDLGDRIEDEEALICFAVTPGGGFTESLYLRGRNSLLQIDADLLDAGYVSTVDKPGREAMSRMLDALNRHGREEA